NHLEMEPCGAKSVLPATCRSLPVERRRTGRVEAADRPEPSLRPTPETDKVRLGGLAARKQAEGGALLKDKADKGDPPDPFYGRATG
ncbi:hypothetical protein ACFY5H_34550, partial [Streptomyces sp. NPDC013012]|uniref:hypothetical protein n=1 Tax=Streptomyces sp. NPDC013012 TaxID=3364860 RepID=UPI00369EB6A0